MEAPPPSRRDQRRDAILAVAAEVFFEEGFQAASMSAIAQRLGGSKATLYAYFKSKEALFEAHVRESCARIASEILDFTDDQPVAEVLSAMGVRYLDRILSDWAVRTFQIVVAEARRHPGLARMFYAAGPRVGCDRLAGYLERAVARGEVNVVDCDEAAWQFFGMCRIHHLEAMLGVAPKPSAAAIRAQVSWAVDLFLLRYSPASR